MAPAVTDRVTADRWMLYPNMQGDAVGALWALPEMTTSWSWFAEHGQHYAAVVFAIATTFLSWRLLLRRSLQKYFAVRVLARAQINTCAFAKAHTPV